MINKIWLGALLMATGSLVCIQRDYKEQMEAAIIKTDLPKVQRLLKRRNKISLKRFNDMLGWANVTIEERRLLESTRKERLILVLSNATAAVVAGTGICYYWDLFGMRLQARLAPGGEKGYKRLAGIFGLLAAYGFYKFYSGPRKRLDDAFSVLFAIEDTVEEIKEKKKKARKKSGI